MEQNNQNNQIIGLEGLGYDEFFEKGRVKAGFGGFGAARVVSEQKGSYIVKNQNGEFFAKITGKRMFFAQGRADYPAVGDWVVIDELPENQAAIHGILPRKTVLERRSGAKIDVQIIATNVDAAFVVQALDGDYSLNRFERYFSLCAAGGIDAIAVLNKTDLVSKEELAVKAEEIKKRFVDAEIIAVSTITDSGLDELKARIEKGKTYCFLGSSGVGKSTIINKLLEKEAIKTGRIDIRTERGRHTTTIRHMYFLPGGGIVIDNPGMREVGMAEAASGVENVFDKIAALAKECKFGDCRHENDPGCAVRAAIQSGEVDAAQFENYQNLKKEAEFFEMDKAQRREKDRDFGKFIKTAKKQLRKLDGL